MRCTLSILWRKKSFEQEESRSQFLARYEEFRKENGTLRRAVFLVVMKEAQTTLSLSSLILMLGEVHPLNLSLEIPLQPTIRL